MGKNKAGRGQRGMVEVGVMMFYKGWSEKVMLRKQHFSRDLKEVSRSCAGIWGKSIRQREQPVLRP